MGVQLPPFAPNILKQLTEPLGNERLFFGVPSMFGSSGVKVPLTT